MVRSITGTLIHFDEKGLNKDYLQEVLESHNRQLSGPTAPPQGLFLWNILYD
jgi:tRNA pseudouridine38-40 synthase